LPPRGAPDRVLELSQTRLDVLTLVFLVGLPVLLAAMGGFIAWRRRRR
jgi:LPXTG-motif cell wall-anchored protein